MLLHADGVLDSHRRDGLLFDEDLPDRDRSARDLLIEAAVELDGRGELAAEEHLAERLDLLLGVHAVRIKEDLDVARVGLGRGRVEAEHVTEGLGEDLDGERCRPREVDAHGDGAGLASRGCLACRLRGLGGELRGLACRLRGLACQPVEPRDPPPPPPRGNLALRGLACLAVESDVRHLFGGQEDRDDGTCSAGELDALLGGVRGEGRHAPALQPSVDHPQCDVGGALLERPGGQHLTTLSNGRFSRIAR